MYVQTECCGYVIMTRVIWLWFRGISAFQTLPHGVGFQTLPLSSLARYRQTIERLRVTSSPIETGPLPNFMQMHFRMASNYSLPHGKQLLAMRKWICMKYSCTNLRHTRATVTALLDFLYKWMPLHLVYTIAMLVCEETRADGLTKRAVEFEFARWKWSVNDEIVK